MKGKISAIKTILNNFSTIYHPSKIRYLLDKGWYLSVQKKISINKNNEPIPWVTYPFLDFIYPRLQKNFKIFEFGSGSSTLWWSNNISKVISCEHDLKWVKKLKPLPSNVEIFHKDLNKGYSDFIKTFSNEFDIVVIDGRKRNKCMKNCIPSLKQDGIIILDDSHRDYYDDGINYLISNEFKKIDFHGIGPMYSKEKCTSIFYRTKNILDI